MFHLETQAAYWLNDAYHSAFPSPQRQAFEHEFGILLKGRYSDIEAHHNTLNDISAALHHRQFIRDSPIPVNNIRIETSRYFFKNFFYQI